jgi:hypothetical protein
MRMIIRTEDDKIHQGMIDLPVIRGEIWKKKNIEIIKESTEPFIIINLFSPNVKVS